MRGRWLELKPSVNGILVTALYVLFLIAASMAGALVVYYAFRVS